MFEEYEKAKKLAEKDYRKAVTSGEYPYLPALEEFFRDGNSDVGIPIGIMEIPLAQVVGTKTWGRQASFARNFMPLLGEETEFAMKWASLCRIQEEEGIRDPIKAYEYMWKFYVLEGNKRVSVSKYAGLSVILADVTRVMPEKRDEPAVRIYYEFDRFFRVAPLYEIIFSEEGCYEKLAELVGQNLTDPWPKEVVKDLSFGYSVFAQIFEQKYEKEFQMTTADAFLIYLAIYGLKSLQENSREMVARQMERIKEEFRVGDTGKQVTFLERPYLKESAPLLLSPFRKTWTQKNPLKIAFLYDEPLAASSWLYGHELGRNHLEDCFDGLVKTRPYEGALAPEIFDRDVEEAAADGAGLIVTTSPLQMEETLRAAVKYPGIKFINCSINLTASAVRSYYGRMHEAKFLMGVLASTVAKNHRVGYVADYPIYGALSRANAFAIGAALTDPEVKVYLTWTSLKEGNWQRFMEENEVRVVSGPDLIKPAEASREYGLYHIEGRDDVKSLAMPVWDWGRYYELIVRSILDGSFDRDQDLSAKTGQALNLKGVVIYILHPVNKGLGLLIMALAAGLLRSLQGIRHPMGSVLLAVLAHIGHMAINAGDTGIMMDTGDPILKLRMLGLQHRSLGVGMYPILLETAGLAALIELELLLRIEAIVPGMIHPAIFLHKIVFVMALGADIGTHIIMGRIVHIHPPAGHGFHEALLVDPQLHGLGIMAAGAAEPFILLNGSRDFVNGLGSISPAAFLEILVIHVGALAGDAGAFLSRQTLRAQEILAGVGMAPGHVVLDRELIALEIHQQFRLSCNIGIALH